MKTNTMNTMAMKPQNTENSNPFFIYEVSTVCATCAKQLSKDRTYSLDTPIDTTRNVNLYQVLESRLQFKCEESGPNNLCPECFSKALLFYEFHQQYKKSVMLFSKYVEYLEQSATDNDNLDVNIYGIGANCTKIKEEPEEKLTIEPEEIYVSNTLETAESAFNPLAEVENIVNNVSNKPHWPSISPPRCNLESNDIGLERSDLALVKVEDETTHSDDIESMEDDSTMDGTPSDHLQTAESSSDLTVPVKSRDRYEFKYRLYCNWKSERGIQVTNEKVFIAFLAERSKTVNPASLWTEHSMLKAMIKLRENIDVAQMFKVKRFLKQNTKNYTPKKSKTLTDQECLKFLQDAPDSIFLMKKVALIVGLYGACRMGEMTNLEVNDVNLYEDHIEVTIKPTSLHARTFTIPNTIIGGIELAEMVKKYIALRPAHAPHRRFFIYYSYGKCTTNPIGKNSFAKMPASIAEYLNLPGAKLYTGYCFRRTSATLLGNEGADVVNLKRRTMLKSAFAEGSCIPEPKE